MADNIEHQDKGELVANCDQLQNDEVVVTTPVESRIMSIRGKQIMIDRDLAELYGVETRVLNQAVKRNMERYPERFRFQLTKEEMAELVTNCDRFNSLKHSTVRSYAFTEQGVAMLSTVLRSETAIRVSIRIMDAFVAMRRFIVTNAEVFQRLSTMEYHQLEMQQHQQETDKRIDEVFRRLDEGNAKPKQGVFYNGQIYDAYTFVSDLIKSAKKRIVLIDNYVDETVLTMTIRRISITFVALLFATISFGQVKSIDERIGEAMNGSNWAELRSLYMSDGKNLQTPFLKPLSKFFISQFYNEPDSAIKYGKEILEKYQEELNSSVPSIMYFIAEDYATLGHYDKASALLHSLNEAYRKGGQTANPVFEAYEDIYSKLSKCGTFSVERPNNNVSVPLLTHTGNRKNPEMMFVMANINGKEVKCTYDSGAGINIMTTKFAEHIKATVIQTKNIQMLGMSYVDSKGLVVVDSLKLGDLVYRNVPFFVVDMRTDNPLANKKLEELGYECVIGNQTMMPLGEICFDFDRMQLVIPASYTPKPAYAPNFYRSPQHLLHLSLTDVRSGRKIDAIVDTGASGTILTNRYYKKNENCFTGRMATDSLRTAGVGGVNVVKTIPVSWTFTLAGEQYTETNIPVVTSSEQNEEYDCRIGLPTLMAHRKFIINFKNMWMRFED